MEDAAAFDRELAAPLDGSAPAPFTPEEEADSFLGLMATQMPGRAGA